MPIKARSGTQDATELPSDLRELIDAARRAAVATRRCQAEHAYHLARLARATLRRTVGTRSAIEVCAHALGMERQTLQPYAVLAARWEPSEIAALLQQGLCLSHLRSLAQARLSKAARATWLERAISEKWEVHELRAQLRQCAQDEQEDDATDCRRGSVTQPVARRPSDR
jgi:hypothetical protein